MPLPSVTFDLEVDGRLAPFLPEVTLPIFERDGIASPATLALSIVQPHVLFSIVVATTPATLNLSVVTPTVTAAEVTEFYVAPDGDNSNPGTLASPWLITKLANPAAVPAGATVYLRGGWYRRGTEIVIGLIGTLSNRITITNYPGEAVIIDRRRAILTSEVSIYTVLFKNAQYVTFKENTTGTLRITNTAGPRTIPINSGRPSGLGFEGSTDCRFVNIRLNDVGNNLMDAGSVGGGSYGVIYQNSGWQWSIRGAAHDAYVQGTATPTTPKKEYLHCIMANGYSLGPHVFGGSDDRPNNAKFEDCFVIQKSSADEVARGTKACAFASGDVHYTTTGVEFRRNVVFRLFPNTIEPKSLCFLLGAPDGYPGTAHNPDGGPIYNGTIVMEDNLIYGTVVIGSRFTAGNNNPSATGREGITFSGNTIIGRFGGAVPNRCIEESWQQNGTSDPQPHYDSFNAAFPSNTRYDSRDGTHEAYDAPTQILVKANPYETGRGHVFIGNINGLGTVNVDLSTICTNGQQYQVYNAENLGAGALQTFTYSGATVPFDMTTKGPPSTPVGGTAIPSNMQSGIYAGVFLVRKNGTTPSEPSEPPPPTEDTSEILALSPLWWWRSDIGVSRTGNDVTGLTDQSGNGRHAEAVTISGFPQWDEFGSNLGDVAAIQFAFNQAYIRMINPITHAQPITVYEVWRPDQFFAAHYVFAVEEGGACALACTGADAFSLVSGVFSPTVTLAPAGKWIITARVYNTTSSLLQVGNAAPQVTNPGTLGYSGWRPTIGAPAGVNTSLTFCTHIAFPGAHDSTTRALVMGHFSDFYSTPLDDTDEGP